MTRLWIALAAVVLLSCSSADAQVGAIGPTSPLGTGAAGSPPMATEIFQSGSPLGITSPLGFSPGSPVGAAGIPLGATELAAPGESPAASAMAAMASPAGPAAPPGAIRSPSSVGRIGIPLGASELSPGGLSPP